MKHPRSKLRTEIADEDDRLIRLMPESLSNKIAAGEVVQRPASVVKELIENAVDAGAANITVQVKGAGSELIQVIDDGCGMSVDDARACFQRHATSKIRSLEDLENIRTLGFRGEALASIASVSQITLRTRRVEEETGIEVELDGGTQRSETPVSALPGTAISVRNLFFNVPARRKFLKRPSTELKHIIDAVEAVALAHPRIGFRLLHGENEIIGVRGSDDTGAEYPGRRRVADVLSPGDADRLISVRESTSYLSVHGFIGRPEHFKRVRGQQYLFVNDRPVTHRSLEHAVVSAYEYLLPDGAYPLFVLFLDIDPRHVDVNVHPAKSEVKFDDESGVYGMLKTIVRKAVGTAEMTPDAGTAVPLDLPSFGQEGNGAPMAGGSDAGRRSVESGRVGEPHESGRERGGAGRNPRGVSGMPAGDLSKRLYESDQLSGLPSGSADARLDDDRGDGSEDLLWQLHDAFILTQIRSGLVILDQQAAHERILYEQARRSLTDGFGLTQQLLFPASVELSAGDFALLEDLESDLRALGFDLEVSDSRTVLLRGVPADMRAGDEHPILEEVFQQHRRMETVDRSQGRENLARCIARRSAVRPGTRLSRREMRLLIDKLFMCEMPWSTPDGKPTIVRLSVDELRTRFGHRSG